MRFIGLCCLLVSICLLTVLTGSSDAVDPWNIQDNAAVPAGALDGANTIGQTFVSHFPGLHALQVRWILSQDFVASSQARITLHLRDREDDRSDIATASLGLNELQNNGFSKFVFPSIPDSAGKSFYFFLELSPDAITRGSLSAWASDDDNYPDGKMYLNGVATDRDLDLRSFYQPDGLFLLGALRVAVGRYGSGLAVALFVFPILGLAFLPGSARGSGVLLLLIQAAGTGLTFISAFSVLFLFLRPANLSLFFGIIFLVACMYGVHRISTLKRGGGKERSAPVVHDRFSALLGVLALLSIGVGLIQIRDDLVPLWVDSRAHAEYIRLLLEQGRLPANAFYHMGYHVATALLAQLAALSIPQAMLLMGQLLITQTGLSVGVLTRRLSNSNVAGIASAIAIWFLSPTPSYFVNWGRYPLLLGGAILPIALYFAMDWIDDDRWSARAFFLTALTFGGLAFAHVRLTVFYLVFVLCYSGYCSLLLRDRHRLLRIGLIAGAGVIFGAVWLGLLFLRGLSWQAVLAENLAAPSIDVSTAVAVMLTQHGILLWLLALGGAFLGIWRRTKASLVTLVWYGGLYLFSILPASPLTGPLISPDLVILMGFLPAAILFGDAVNVVGTSQILSNAPYSLPASVLASITFVLMTLTGARDMISITNPATVLFSGADAKAMTWIKENTPANATVLVNSFEWFKGVYVPADGGAWIPYLTGRQIAYLESAPSLHLDDPSLERELARKINFVYLGWRSGILQRSDFACRTDRYKRVYERDGIEIFQVEGQSPGLPGLPVDDCTLRGVLDLPFRGSRIDSQKEKDGS
jgi:hypothetical protein